MSTINAAGLADLFGGDDLDAELDLNQLEKEVVEGGVAIDTVPVPQIIHQSEFEHVKPLGIQDQ